MAYIRNMGKRSTLNYRFSIDSKDDKQLAELRKMISDHNSRVRKYARLIGTEFKSYVPDLQRVRIQGRGPRRHDGRNYLHSLPHKYATSFDVYVDVDKDAMEALRIEIIEGFTPAMQRKRSKLQHELWLLEWEAKERRA